MRCRQFTRHLVAFIAIAVQLGAQGDERGRPLIQRYSAKEYRGHYQVWSAVQTPDGAMWFGSLNGVLQFDGAVWRHHPVPTSFVRQTVVGTDGMLYVAGEEAFGRLERHPDGTFHYRSLLDTLAKEDQPIGLPRRLVALSEGVFAAADRAVFRWHDGKLQTWRFGAQRRNAIDAVAGTLYLVRGAEGIFRFENGNFVPFANCAELSHPQFTFLLPPPPETSAIALLCLGRDGLFLVGADGKISAWSHAASEALKPVQSFSGIQLRDGEYAIATIGGGVFILAANGRSYRQYLPADGLTHEAAIGVGEDREGGLWVTTQNGINRIDRANNATLFDDRDGLGDGILFDLVRQDGVLYAAYNETLMKLVPATSAARAHWEKDDRLPPGTGVKHIVPHPGGLLVGSETVWVVNKTGVVPLPKSKQGGISTLAPSVTEPNRVFVAYDTTVGTLLWRDGQWIDEGIIPGVEGVTQYMYEEPDGVLWAATDARGVYRVTRSSPQTVWQAAHATNYFERNGLPTGSGWVLVGPGPFGASFPTEKGTFRYNPIDDRFELEDRFVIDGKRNAYLVEGLASGGNRNEWWAAAEKQRPNADFPLLSGIRNENTKDLLFSPAPVGVSSLLGISGAQFVYGEPDTGVTWVKGMDVLLRLERDVRKRPLTGWRPTVQSFEAEGHAQPIGSSPLRLSYSTEPITFSYSAAVFRRGAAPQYQARLVGFHDAWSDFSDRTETEFTNLSGGPFTFEVRAKDGDGNVSDVTRVIFSVAPPWHQSAAALLMYALLGFGAVLGFVRWRTSKSERERRRLELIVTERTAQLKIAKEQADAANQAKSTFLANMSHELRTPLNGVIGYAQVLMKDPEVTPRNRERLRIVQTSGEHLLRMINEVLDFSKIEAGKMELTTTPFHLPQLLRDVAAAASPRFEQKRLEFVFDPAGDLPDLVLGDPLKLRQVIDNLLSNAAKFTASGTVRFIVRATTTETFEFSIADTGVGISEADLTRLFTPFQQAADGRPPEPGTGLGLAISQRIVGLMGGKLEVESHPGRGSRFFFVVKLPVIAENSEARRSTGSIITGYAGQRRKLLVVDDVATNRDVLRELLTPLGFDIREAASGDEALRLVPQLRPDAVFLDLRMPGMDGLELARRLRETEPGKKLKLFAMSASVLSFNREKAFAAGCDDFLPKPFREDDLLARLGLALQLEWIGNAETTAKRRDSTSPFPSATTVLDRGTVEELLAITQRGEIAQLRARLATLPADALVETLDGLAKAYRMERIREVLETQLAKLRSPS